MDKILLTAEEAGQLLSLGRTKVYELIATGELESVTVGRSRRVPADALSRFVHLLEQGPGRSDTPGAEWARVIVRSPRPPAAPQAHQERRRYTPRGGR